jgi:hypothetical protein
MQYQNDIGGIIGEVCFLFFLAKTDKYWFLRGKSKNVTQFLRQFLSHNMYPLCAGTHVGTESGYPWQLI